VHHLCIPVASLPLCCVPHCKRKGARTTACLPATAHAPPPTGEYTLVRLARGSTNRTCASKPRLSCCLEPTHNESCVPSCQPLRHERTATAVDARHATRCVCAAAQWFCRERLPQCMRKRARLTQYAKRLSPPKEKEGVALYCGAAFGPMECFESYLEGPGEWMPQF